MLREHPKSTHASGPRVERWRNWPATVSVSRRSTASPHGLLAGLGAGLGSDGLCDTCHRLCTQPARYLLGSNNRPKETRSVIDSHW